MECGSRIDAAMALDGEVLGKLPSLALEKKIAEVFVALRDPVYRYLQAVLSDAQAEEITQEAFIRLLRELRRGRSVENVRAWVFRVAHNLAIDEVRRQRAEESSVPLDDPTLVLELREPAAGPEQGMLDREKRQQVRQAITRLSPLERQCLELRAEGLRYREIAEVLETRIPNVQALLVRAVTKVVRNIHV